MDTRTHANPESFTGSRDAHDQAIAKGRNARKAGLSQHMNPYAQAQSFHVVLKRAWAAGWHSLARVAEDAKG